MTAATNENSMYFTGKLAGLVTPFCHPFHEYPKDYRRFTPDGLKEMAGQLAVAAEGWRTGPTATLLVFVIEYAKLLLPWRAWRAVCGGVLGWVLFPLRYVDLLFFRSARAGRIAASTFTSLFLRHQPGRTAEMATRSSRLGRKMVRINKGRYHAMHRPPWWACQNWVANITVAEQLSSVPRFFRRPDGHAGANRHEQGQHRNPIGRIVVLPEARRLDAQRIAPADHACDLGEEGAEIVPVQGQRGGQRRQRQQDPAERIAPARAASKNCTTAAAGTTDSRSARRPVPTARPKTAAADRRPASKPTTRRGQRDRSGW